MDRSRPLVIVAGAAAQVPRYGGHTWVFLQYLLGFRRLGFEVLLIDRLLSTTPADCAALDRLQGVFARFGLHGALAVLDGDGQPLTGPSRRELVATAGRCRMLLNVNGFLTDAELLEAAPRRAFLDIDPGFPQMWRALGQADVLAGHDVYVTFAENIGGDGCTIPTCGLDWVTTRPPVVLEQWPAREPVDRPAFTSIGAWRGPFDAIEFEGERYGLRAHEFRALAPLPALSGTRFEGALDIDPDDGADRRALQNGGWELRDPVPATADPETYREFIAGAGAELMVAKEIYARTRSGWFSDRSACFRARGRPVLASDTAASIPDGEGLIVFDSLEQALDGVEAIRGDYEHHARVARALAEEWFDSDRVLSRLLEEVGAA